MASKAAGPARVPALDPELPMLAEALHRARMEERLRPMIPEAGMLESIRLVKHRPGRRCDCLEIEPCVHGDDAEGGHAGVERHHQRFEHRLPVQSERLDGLVAA